jgi:hypothetical protein
MSVISNIKATAVAKGGRGLLQLRRVSPEILTVVGVAGVVATAVLASRATLKLEDTVDELNFEVDRIKRNEESAIELGHDKDEHFKRQLLKAYVKGYSSIGKLYAPAGTVGLVSIAAMIGAQGIMHQRNVGLLAAYKAVETGWAQYRKRVVDEYGEEVDRNFRTGLRAVEQKGEDGKKEVAMVYDKTLDPKTDYARIFGQDNLHWRENPDSNLHFLRSVQNYANDRLQSVGHVTLNEVYKDLGMELSSAGAVVGWVKDNREGDNYIDFGIYDNDNIRRGAQIDGTEGHILVDFNVDGVIYDLIDQVNERKKG